MNKLVEITFTQSYTYEKNRLTKAELDILQPYCSKPIHTDQLSKYQIDNKTAWISEKDKDHPDTKILVDCYDISGYSNIVNLNALLDVVLPIEYKIVHTLSTLPEYSASATLLSTMLKMEERLNTFDKLAQVNYKIGVHISDLGLLNVKCVEAHTDMCTDDLQRMLDKGWRILAVCPQASRRPDYILGRNSKID